MGKIIRLGGVNLTDAFAPQIIERDLIESAGSLFLFDGAHDYGAFVGVPGVGGSVPNALWNKAASLIGSGTESSLALAVSARTPDSAIWKVERTLKGGVHGIPTQAGGNTGSLTWAINTPAAIRDYVLSVMNTHELYFSIWTRVTRNGLSSTTVGQSPFHLAQNTSNYLFTFQGGLGANYPLPPRRVGYLDSPAHNDHTAAVTPYTRFAAKAVNAASGTGPTSAQQLGIRLGIADAWNTFNYNSAPSRIIYRAYAEDLTASGRTYAEVAAIDYAMYQAAFAVGGKFYGDTFTNPTAIP